MALRFRAVLLEKRRQRQAGLEPDKNASHNVNTLTLLKIPLLLSAGMVTD